MKKSFKFNLYFIIFFTFFYFSVIKREEIGGIHEGT